MPATQSTQMNKFVAYVPYCPAAHAVSSDVHDDAPEAEVLPNSQGMHFSAPPIEYIPAAHKEHSLALLLEYIPAAQSVHFMEFQSLGAPIVPYCPATQYTVSDSEHDAAPTPEAIFIGHGIQRTPPTMAE